MDPAQIRRFYAIYLFCCAKDGCLLAHGRLRLSVVDRVMTREDDSPSRSISGTRKAETRPRDCLKRCRGWGPLRGIEMWGDRATAPFQDIWIGGFQTCVATRYKNMLREEGAIGFAPMRTWRVYRLIDARGRPFYIGCTSAPTDRLQDHVDAPAAAARARCRELRALGLRPRQKIVRTFDRKRAAYEFANRLILKTRGLVNAPLRMLGGGHHDRRNLAATSAGKRRVFSRRSRLPPQI